MGAQYNIEEEKKSEAADIDMSAFDVPSCVYCLAQITNED